MIHRHAIHPFQAICTTNMTQDMISGKCCKHKQGCPATLYCQVSIKVKNAQIIVIYLRIVILVNFMKYRVSQKKRTFIRPPLPTFQSLEYLWREGTFPPLIREQNWNVDKSGCLKVRFFWDTLYVFVFVLCIIHHTSLKCFFVGHYLKGGCKKKVFLQSRFLTH